MRPGGNPGTKPGTTSATNRLCDFWQIAYSLWALNSLQKDSKSHLP